MAETEIYPGFSAFPPQSIIKQKIVFFALVCVHVIATFCNGPREGDCAGATIAKATATMREKREAKDERQRERERKSEQCEKLIREQLEMK